MTFRQGIFIFGILASAIQQLQLEYLNGYVLNIDCGQGYSAGNVLPTDVNQCRLLTTFPPETLAAPPKPRGWAEEVSAGQPTLLWESRGASEEPVARWGGQLDRRRHLGTSCSHCLRAV